MTRKRTTAHRSRLRRTASWAWRRFRRMSFIGQGVTLLLVVSVGPPAVALAWEASLRVLTLGVRIAGVVGVACLLLYAGRNSLTGPLWRPTARGLSWLSGWLSGLLRFRRRVQEPDAWAPIEARLVQMLVKTRKVKVEEGHALPRIPLLAPPAQDDAGNVTWVIGLPDDVMFSDIVGLHERVARCLECPTSRLKITPTPGHSADRATLTIEAEPVERVELPVRDWTPPVEHRWSDPCVIGRDRLTGDDITIPTAGKGCFLVSGRSNRGKTSTMFVIAGHWAADPTTSIYVADGKSSVNDWGPLLKSGRTERTLYAKDDPDGVAFLAMLDQVYAMSVDRQAQPFGTDGKCTAPGVLLIIEEYVNFVEFLPTKAKDEATKKVMRLVSTCRAANIVVMLAVQEPNEKMMPTFIRKNSNVGITMNQHEQVSYGMVLGPFDKTLPEPKAPGQAWVRADDQDDAAVVIDRAELAAWGRFCKRLPSRPRPETVDPTTDAPKVQHDDDGLPHTARPVYVPTGRRGVGVDQPDPTPQPLHSVPDLPEPAKAPDARELVLAALAAAGGTATTKGLIEATGKARRTVGLALSTLTVDGLVEPDGHGQHRLTDAGQVEAAS